MKTSYSRHELYALGEPLGDGATRKEVGRVIYGGGGGGGPTYTESKVSNSNIPEYAQPYVENMLGASQKQVYGADGTSFQPYKAYGGTYDAAGNQTSYDPGRGIAGFQPLQQKAQTGVQNMQLPDQYRQAMNFTGAGIGGGFDVVGQSNVGGFQNQVGGYMSPYMQNVVDIQKREAGRQSDIQGTQQQAQATQAGAFGGSRDAIMRSERERNLGQQMNDIQAQGSQAAFQGAQQQYNQNLQNQLAGYGQAMQGANQLASLGNQQLQAQQGIYGLQNQYGAQQQALEQSKLNQAQQDYANQQQYPMMQLGSLSNMLRGLPMQSSSTNMYQAQPNALTQGIGAAGTMGSLYNAYNNPNSSPNAPRTMAAGGITSIPRYDIGGTVRSQLMQKPDEELQREAKESPSQEIRRMAAEILKMRQAGMDSAPQMDMAPQPQQGMGMAGGGIIAFAKGDEVEYKTTKSQEKDKQREEDRERLLTVPAAIADLIRTPGNAIVNAIGVHGANLSNRAINAITGTDLKTDYGPGLPYGTYLDAVQKPTRTGPDGRATTTTDPRVKAAVDTPPDMSGIKAAVPDPVETPAAAPKAGPAPASSDEPIYTGTEHPPEFLRAMEAQAAAGNSNSADLLRAYYKKFPKAVAPTVDPNSIMAAAPTADKAAMAAAQVDPFTEAKAALAKANTEAGKTKKELYDEDLEAKKALGLDQNEAQQAYMKRIMGQQSNIAADAEQKKYLRLAKFFATWGSTPGDTLVAGMQAVKAKIPDMIADIKEQRKAEAEADKVLYELGQAVRQEKLGNWDKVELRKTKAAEIAAKLQGDLTIAQANFEGQKLTREGMLAVARINKEGSLEVAGIQAKASKHHADTSADAQKYSARLADHARTEAAAGRLASTQLNALLHASTELGNLPAKLERARVGNKEYEAAVRAESMLAAQLTQDPTNKELLVELTKAQNKLGEYKNNDAEIIIRAQGQVDALAKKAFGADFTAFTSTTTPKIVDPFAKP